ncbi:GGDEF domain-containing protein [Actinoplanes sp. NPDC051633]|uniref:GGDEF domain-containing protein n=1 Tax=Actinoplanes sp. NPDC051633 TaxID=3155670 RepID=UPI00342961BC
MPVPVSPYGPLGDLALHVHGLTLRGHHPETLIAADEAVAVARLYGDARTERMVEMGRVYALAALGRLTEALSVSGRLAELTGTATGPRTTDAKILADTGDMLIRMGRIDEGLHQVARAMAMLEVAPRGTWRYLSAMSSLSGAAQAAELFELADMWLTDIFGAMATDFDELFRSAGDLQRAELRQEWALRLEQVDHEDEAAALFASSVELLRYWHDRELDAPLCAALLAVGLAKIREYDQALILVGKLLMPMREAGQWHEARMLHLAHGVALRETGDLVAARRELLAADQLAVLPQQRLIYRYELAVLAVRESPGPTTRSLLETVKSQLALLWRLRLDRRTMLRQARRRVELEAARARADLVATSDALTGLGNRRTFDLRIDDLRDNLLLMDVDRFKAINDAYSHVVGDRVLSEIAGVLRSHGRAADVPIRLGGDEFAMILPGDVLSAAVLAERIRQVVLGRDWAAIAPGLSVTVSMGLASPAEGLVGRELYDRADRRLYEAKHAGRNRLIFG